uniref:Uncharacterized protein n=1 Tax=Rhizophora mucronata TaxID=61149 RepID=A0A2P2NCI2_RHIMU
MFPAWYYFVKFAN